MILSNSHLPVQFTVIYPSKKRAYRLIWTCALAHRTDYGEIPRPQTADICYVITVYTSDCNGRTV